MTFLKSLNPVSAIKQNRSRATLMMFVAALAAVAAGEALAGTGTGTFDQVWQTVTDWTQGTLGRIITLAMIVVGVVAGIGRQSLLAFATGLGAGVGMYNAPDIVEAILQATLPAAEKATPVIMQLSNGL
ncbi:TraA family conjugative transfer protein [Halomonas sp. I5-271120]|uniref:TraA family conjugative transfer protein n=1 Tax=Halomonas sp. I5-271120 TaxID=3061632 RepID=UPI0027155307|nr:TraA family conjugative transfer protein [Halomonas sp. I5-271120]